MSRGGLVSADHLRNNPIHEEMYSIKDQNHSLKKQLNNQGDTTKKLMTQVQRLSDDLRKSRSGSNTKIGVMTRGEREVDSSVHEMRSQMAQTQKINSDLRNKVQYFKSLHEAEVRKRAPYDHIPPRINTGIQRRMVPGLGRKKGRIEVDNSYEQGGQVDTSEDIQKLYFSTTIN
jgi:chromosome segregation ATPase